MSENIEEMYKIYSLEGLEMILTDTEDKKQRLIRDRDNLGKSWTESKVADWIRHHNQEIKECDADIENIKKCIEYKKEKKSCPK